MPQDTFKKNGEKYLIIDSTENYEEFFSGIKSGIETLNGGKELIYKKNHARTGVNTDDDLPLNKPLKFPTLTIIIRCVLQKGKKLYRKFICAHVCMSYKNVAIRQN